MSRLISKFHLLEMPEGTIFAISKPETPSATAYTSVLYRKGRSIRTPTKWQCEARPLFLDGDDRTPPPSPRVEVRLPTDSCLTRDVYAFERCILVYQDDDILALYRGLETELARIADKPTAIGPQRAAPSSPARVEAQSRSALREYNSIASIDPDWFKREYYNHPEITPRERRFLSRLEEGGE